MNEYNKSPKGYCYKKHNGVTIRISLEEFNEFKKNIKKLNQEGGGFWSRLFSKKEQTVTTNSDKTNNSNNKKRSFWERWIWKPKKKQQINTRTAEKKISENLIKNSYSQLNNITKKRENEQRKQLQNTNKKNELKQLIKNYSDKKRGINLNLDKINNDKRNIHEYLKNTKGINSTPSTLKNSLNTLNVNKLTDYEVNLLHMKLQNIKKLREDREQKILKCSKRNITLTKNTNNSDNLYNNSYNDTFNK